MDWKVWSWEIIMLRFNWGQFLLDVLGDEKGLLSILDVVRMAGPGDDKGLLEVGEVLLNWRWRRDCP